MKACRPLENDGCDYDRQFVRRRRAKACAATSVRFGEVRIFRHCLRAKRCGIADVSRAVVGGEGPCHCGGPLAGAFWCRLGAGFSRSVKEQMRAVVDRPFCKHRLRADCGVWSTGSPSYHLSSGSECELPIVAKIADSIKAATSAMDTAAKKMDTAMAKMDTAAKKMDKKMDSIKKK